MPNQPNAHVSQHYDYYKDNGQIETQYFPVNIQTSEYIESYHNLREIYLNPNPQKSSGHIQSRQRTSTSTKSSNQGMLTYNASQRLFINTPASTKCKNEVLQNSASNRVSYQNIPMKNKLHSSKFVSISNSNSLVSSTSFLSLAQTQTPQLPSLSAFESSHFKINRSSVNELSSNQNQRMFNKSAIIKDPLEQKRTNAMKVEQHDFEIKSKSKGEERDFRDRSQTKGIKGTDRIQSIWRQGSGSNTILREVESSNFQSRLQKANLQCLGNKFFNRRGVHRNEFNLRDQQSIKI